MKDAKGANISVRLLALAVAVIRIGKRLPRDAAGRHIEKQMIRAGTSGGANYEEARAAESRAAFIHKVSISAQELRETIYWLRLIRHAEMTSISPDPIIQEAKELVAILIASGRTARANAR